VKTEDTQALAAQAVKNIKSEHDLMNSKFVNEDDVRGGAQYRIEGPNRG